MQYKGTRWFKCDFHLHTIASKCFQNDTEKPEGLTVEQWEQLNAEQWVEQAIKAGLECVAITDHNTGAGIDAIKEAAQNKNLTVFPSVEITCDTSKIHLLVLFDVDKSSQDVEDFLTKCDIDRIDFGEQDASSQQSIFDIVKIAKNRNALVIPAHIDEFNGLNIASHDNLEDFYTNSINAVHIVHKEFLEEQINYTQLKTYLNEYYDNPSPAIDDASIKKCHKSVQLALKHKKAILSFSDNPHAEKSPKHGLWGIGRRYSWIKMEEQPTLDSLKQAFLFPETRVKNCFEYQNTPYKQPDLWIKSIKVLNTHITDDCLVEFSPQLNTIIGGRGSGKSSILKFIRGVFNRMDNLNGLKKIEDEHTNFYKKHDNKEKNGVLSLDTIIEVFFVRHEINYKITASQNNSAIQSVKIEKSNELEDWEEISAVGFIDFFQFEHFSQKQIYEIADKPNSLREMIDVSSHCIGELKITKEEVKTSFLAKCANIRLLKQQVSAKGRLQTEISDFVQRISAYNKVHDDIIFQEKTRFTNQEESIACFKSHLEHKVSALENLLNNFTPQNFSSEVEELNNYANEINNDLFGVKNKLNALKIDIISIKEGYSNKIEVSAWKKDFDKNKIEYESKKSELSELGITQIEQLNESKSKKENELEKIITVEKELLLEESEKERLKAKYIEILKEITAERQEFVKRILANENVKIDIKPFRNKSDFEQNIRMIFGREIEYKKDIDKLVEQCFQGKVEDKVKYFYKTINDIRLNIQESEDGRFTKFLKDITDVQLDEIELLMPEDDIEVKYKPTETDSYKSLSTASAGQKTTAILTFILSHGETPLILDQPEDDLDNRLIYDLIVQRLKTAKEKRQLIIVTHNANIPVNADAEYVISMNSTSKKIEPFKMGSVDSPEIKNEICSIMEGGENAFKMRSERYNMK